MAKCNQCLHKYICEIRTCAECVGGYCDECQLYIEYDEKPDIENCKYFINEEKPFNVGRCKNCKFYEKVEYYHPTEKATKSVCRLFKRQMQPDDFCSYGERKSDNE
jgi:hypothetical protein